MVLISGYSGIGKSVLANSLQRHVTETNGFMVLGKFDQQQSVEPYTAFISAFSKLTDAILARSSEDIIQSIKEAVGEDAGVLTKVVPSLERILGDEWEVTAAGPVEARNRLKFLFRQFIQAISSHNPLVVVLDDLQWIDTASFG